MKQTTFKWPLLYLSLAKRSKELFKNKIQKKKNIFLEFPGFEAGNSDPIANHITTRPLSIYRISDKNFAQNSVNASWSSGCDWQLESEFPSSNPGNSGIFFFFFFEFYF